MSKRLEAWEQLFNCPIHRSAMENLCMAEIQICEDFIKKNDYLNYAEFNVKLAEWMLEKPFRPKHQSTAYAMVMSANGILYKKENKK